MARPSIHQNNSSAQYVALRITRVIDENANLPRPKLTQQIIMIGSERDCRSVINELVLLPQNQSTDQIEVELKVVKYDNQKTGTSARPGNGQRQVRR